MSSHYYKRELNIIIGLLFTIILILSISSCQTPAELAQRKLNRDKVRIARIIAKNPSLKSVSNTTYTQHDTTVINKTHYQNDSFYVSGGIRVDTLVQLTDADSIFNVKINDWELKLAKMWGGQVRATVVERPHYIHEIDTVHTSDTIFVINTVNDSVTVVDTKQSFWWNLWFQVKGWLWVILIVAAILVILRVIFKFLK